MTPSKQTRRACLALAARELWSKRDGLRVRARPTPAPEP